jgi:hypothetical protein
MARTVVVGEDKFYTDAIGGARERIDSVQGQLAADRCLREVDERPGELCPQYIPEIETPPNCSVRQSG